MVWSDCGSASGPARQDQPGAPPAGGSATRPCHRGCRAQGRSTPLTSRVEQQHVTLLGLQSASSGLASWAGTGHRLRGPCGPQGHFAAGGRSLQSPVKCPAWVSETKASGQGFLQGNSEASGSWPSLQLDLAGSVTCLRLCF